MATRMTATVVDLWIPQYADEPNPGPHAVATALTDLGILRSRYHLISGNSHEILPLLASKQFDVILVDGDHTPAGAEQDLRDAVRLLNNKGRIWFDDAVPELLPVWRKVLSTLPQFQCTEYLDCARPWAEAVR
jgi:predicted O-methyltransferase YrrM